jgi:hypothetical protein
MNRETWLNNAIVALRPLFEAKGIDAPADVKVSCSFPGGGSPNKRIGEAWPRSRSKAGVNEIFISPTLDDKTRVLDVLVHEMCHVADDCKSGHRGAFAKAARAIGLVGPLTATTAGDELKAHLEALPLGAYPHEGLLMGKGKRSDRSGARVKLTCKTEGMSFWVSKEGFQLLQSCPFCEEDCHDS